MLVWCYAISLACSEWILLTRHNQESTQWSPDLFPCERVGSRHESTAAPPPLLLPERPGDKALLLVLLFITTNALTASKFLWLFVTRSVLELWDERGLTCHSEGANWPRWVSCSKHFYYSAIMPAIWLFVVCCLLFVCCLFVVFLFVCLSISISQSSQCSW